MNTLDAFLEQAWTDHADDAAAVAARLPEGLSLVQDGDGAMSLASLAHHVFGEHLGRWHDGLAFLEQLAERNLPGASSAASLARCRASLSLSGGLADERAPMNASDRCRVTAMAAGNLAARDPGRASALLTEAQALAAGLSDDDPGVRVLAANANNIAATLNDRAPLEPAPRDLMLRAAQASRTQWERAGTWLEVERAEYRLALCHLAAEDPAQALRHAELCESLVRENGSVPLEVFFAAEARCLSARALGDAAAATAASAAARQAFDALSTTDQGWCRATLDKLEQS